MCLSFSVAIDVSYIIVSVAQDEMLILGVDIIHGGE